MSRSWRPLTIALIMVCQSTQALALGGIALMLPLIRQDLGLSFAEAGMLSAASGLVYAAMQIPSGYIADRLGPKRLFIAGVIGANVMTATFTLIESYPLLLANQAVSGAFRALIFTPGLLLMQAEFGEGRRATASGLAIAGGLIFNIGLNLAGPLLVGGLGWRGVLVVCAVAILLGAVAFALTGPGPVRSGQAPLRIAELARLAREPMMQWVGVVNFVRHAVVNGWNFWLPTYLTNEKGLTLATAGALAALGTALTLPGNYAGGYLSDQLGRPIGVIVAGFLMLACGLVLLAHAGDMTGILAAVVLVGLFIQFAFGPSFAYPVRIVGQHSAGVVTGFSNTCANAGGLTAAYLLGLGKDLTGSFAIGLYGLVAVCLIGVLASFMLAATARAYTARKAASAGGGVTPA